MATLPGAGEAVEGAVLFAQAGEGAGLGAVGERLAQAAVPAITAALKDENEYVRGAAASALKKIDPEAARKAGIE